MEYYEHRPNPYPVDTLLAIPKGTRHGTPLATSSRVPARPPVRKADVAPHHLEAADLRTEGLGEMSRGFPISLDASSNPAASSRKSRPVVSTVPALRGQAASYGSVARVLWIVP